MANACFYKVFLSMNYIKVSAPSLLFSMLSLQNETQKDILPEGALRALPSNLPTLFNGIERVV
jgi:hypothetical protein